MVYDIQSKEDLDRVIAGAGDKLVVIDFYAPWCGPCKIISPKLEELAAKHKDRCVVVKVDVDTCEDIAIDFDVTSMPTFVFIKEKTTLDVCIGGDAEKLEKNFENFASNVNAAINESHADAPAPNISEQEEALVSVDG